MMPAPTTAAARCRVCTADVRTSAEIAAELRAWVPTNRARHIKNEELYAAKYPSTAPTLREVSEGADRFSAYCAELELPALALELEGLCRCCAYRAAMQFVWLRRLVFEGLLAAFRTSGRDERAEEEFELARCAA